MNQQPPLLGTEIPALDPVDSLESTEQETGGRDMFPEFRTMRSIGRMLYALPERERDIVVGWIIDKFTPDDDE